MKKSDLKVGQVYAIGSIREGKDASNAGMPALLLSTDIWRKGQFSIWAKAPEKVGGRQSIPGFVNRTKASVGKTYKPRADDGKGYLVATFTKAKRDTNELKALTVALAEETQLIRTLVAFPNPPERYSAQLEYVYSQPYQALVDQGIEFKVVSGREVYGLWAERVNTAADEKELRDSLNAAAKAESDERVAKAQALVDRLTELTGVPILDRIEEKRWHYPSTWAADRYSSPTIDVSTKALMLSWNQVRAIIAAIENGGPVPTIQTQDEAWEYEEGQH